MKQEFSGLRQQLLTFSLSLGDLSEALCVADRGGPKLQWVCDCGLLLGRLWRVGENNGIFLPLSPAIDCWGRWGIISRWESKGGRTVLVFLACFLACNFSWCPYCIMGFVNILDTVKHLILTQQSPFRCILDTWSLSPLRRREMLRDIPATRRYSSSC